MECRFGTPEEISACIFVLQRWLPLVGGLLGVGSFALIGALLWHNRRLRSDIAKRERDLDHERALRRSADDTVTEARHRASLADSAATRAKRDKEELEVLLRSDTDELHNQLVNTKARLATVSSQVDGALETTSGGTGKFWSREVGARFGDFARKMDASIPILLFANQKGGVGKSTLVTNLAAAFAERGERVLTVDLDYQGSHSSLAQLQIGEGDRAPESLIDFLFQDVLDPNWPSLTIRKISENFHFIPAFYDFELIERKVEYRWALGLTEDDVRYRLARALLSEAAQSAQSGYDRILIDAPPRFTLGFVNGICASTHLYVPTVVDGMSTSAVSAFARQFGELHPVVNPYLKWSGIIGTMTFVNPRDPLTLTKKADEAASAAERAAQSRLRTHEPLFIRRPVIRRDSELARATESGIAYLIDPSVRPMFDELASVIEAKAPSRRTRS